MLGHTPEAMPGWELTKVSDTPHGKFTTQKPEHGDIWEMPPTHMLGKVTMHLDAEGRTVQSWPRLMPDAAARDAAMRAVVEALKADLPHAEPVLPVPPCNEDLLNQYTITDLHFGQLSWREETGDDYDLKIAEQLLLDWFAMAIKLSPNAKVGLLAQIGDLLHFDGLESVTPTSRHVLDSDSRFAKIVRVVIRTLRRILKMLLEKHEHVHVIMADANHDPASEIWLREMFAAFYEDEPRITVDRTACSYYAYEWGSTSLFYHHGHKRKIKEVDTVFAGRYREIFGRTKHSYAHLGHLHSDEVFPTNLMKVERHETLAAPSSYEANGGWNKLGRSAKTIFYSRQFGEVGRLVIPAGMVQQS